MFLCLIILCLKSCLGFIQWLATRPWFLKGNWATNDAKEEDNEGEVEAKLLLFATLF
jgi:hypothetical protein